MVVELEVTPGWGGAKVQNPNLTAGTPLQGVVYDNGLTDNWATIQEQLSAKPGVYLLETTPTGGAAGVSKPLKVPANTVLRGLWPGTLKNPPAVPAYGTVRGSALCTTPGGTYPTGFIVVLTGTTGGAECLVIYATGLTNPKAGVGANALGGICIGTVGLKTSPTPITGTPPVVASGSRLYKVQVLGGILQIHGRAGQSQDCDLIDCVAQKTRTRGVVVQKCHTTPATATTTIVLTTVAGIVVGQYCLDMTRTTNVQPGIVTAVNATTKTVTLTQAMKPHVGDTMWFVGGVSLALAQSDCMTWGFRSLTGCVLTLTGNTQHDTPHFSTPHATSSYNLIHYVSGGSTYTNMTLDCGDGSTAGLCLRAWGGLTIAGGRLQAGHLKTGTTPFPAFVTPGIDHTSGLCATALYIPKLSGRISHLVTYKSGGNPSDNISTVTIDKTAITATGTTAALYNGGSPGRSKGVTFKGVRQATIPTGTTTMPITTVSGPYAAATFGPTAKMAGNGAYFTPQVTGKVLITISGYCANATAAAANVVMCGRYGTGTHPVKTAATTGTKFAQTTVSVRGGTFTASGGIASFTLTAVVSGLTVGTRYWVDFSIRTSVTADKANVGHVMTTILETH